MSTDDPAASPSADEGQPTGSGGEGAPTATTQGPAKQQGNTLRIVLIVILLVALVALFIDRRSRSAAQELEQQIAGMLQTAVEQAEELPTQEEVHAAIDREPSTSYEHEAPNTLVEEYRFRRGLPWDSYTVYVYYRTEPDMRLDNVSLNQLLPPDEF